MFDWLDETLGKLETGVASLDLAQATGEQAERLLLAFDRALRLCEAGRLVAIARIDETSRHFDSGAPSPGRLIARLTGTGVGEATGELETTRRLTELPATTAAVKAGELSPTQVRLVAEAASVRPDKELELLEVAKTESAAELRRRCRLATESTRPEADKVAAEEELHRRRYLRTWVAPDGAGRGEFLLPPLAFARLLAGLCAEEKAVFEEAERQGRRESSGAYLADALVALAERESRPGRITPTIVCRVDIAAFFRGHTEDGESCEIDGVGPVSVATARSILGESFLKIVIMKGRDPRSITHFGRAVSSHVVTALFERDRACVVCGSTRNLEKDHYKQDFADRGPTELANLALLCRSCHRMKTHRGWKLQGGPGDWRWVAPEKQPGPFDEPPGVERSTTAA
jgi:hypothetical protein